jgi:hypothetical protein
MCRQVRDSPGVVQETGSETQHSRNQFDLWPECGRIVCSHYQQGKFPCCADIRPTALVAQSVEHVLGKNGVTSSSLVEGSFAASRSCYGRARNTT